MILIAHGNTVLADEVVLIACDMAQVRIRVVHNQKRYMGSCIATA
jgi:hypothetical protein